MYRNLMLPALVALALTACKPTPRTANIKPRPAGQTEQSAPPPAPAAPTAESPAPAAPVAETPQASAATSLLCVTSTRQDFNRMRPWEKGSINRSELMGVYLGEGKVLTCGHAANAATYVEISLPDGSRTVPARVLRHDRDLGLALLTPVHAEDASIFETREALELGAPLKLGARAEYHGLVNGLIPVCIPLLAESCIVATPDVMLSLPRLSMRAAQPVPEEGTQGMPIVQGGKLVALSTGYDNSAQALTCINTELLARFLGAQDGAYASCPLPGLMFAQLDDPVFRRYLKLAEGQGGIYIKSLLKGSAAEQAGLKEGDVVTAIDGYEIDTQGRCHHPLYGAMKAEALLCSLRPVGEALTLSVSREGQKQEVVLPLNRDAYSKHIIGGVVPPGVQPRYVMWGGLLFQPMTQDYIKALMSRSNGSMPLEFLKMDDREDELMEQGVTELVMLTQVIPTPATLSYDSVGYCVVESVNGKRVHNFAEFVQLLDEPTADGLVAFSINKAPYTIYVDRRTAEAANSSIRRSAIQQLRHLGEPAEAPAAPEPMPAP